MVSGNEYTNHSVTQEKNMTLGEMSLGSLDAMGVLPPVHNYHIFCGCDTFVRTLTQLLCLPPVLVLACTTAAPTTARSEDEEWEKAGR